MKNNSEIVQMLFYLRFRSQLRRTKPYIVSYLEETVTKAAEAAGGHISDSRRLLNVTFNSSRVGFWLDILILVQALKNVINKNKHELSGYALVLTQGEMDSPEQLAPPEQEAERLCRSLSAGAVSNHTGIWCSAAIQEIFEFYCHFEKPVDGYGEITKFKSFKEPGKDFFFPNRDNIVARLASGKEENTLVIGPPFIGKRDAVHYYCAAMMKDMPPLTIRFKPGVPGPGCFADSLTPYLRSMFKELDTPATLLFSERLREPISPFIIDEVKRFLYYLLQNYWKLVRRKYTKALIILENPLAADKVTASIFREVFLSLENKDDFFVFGINAGETENRFKKWNHIFPRILKLSATDFPVPQIPDMSAELWEAAYTFSLLGRYFSSELFPQLLEEEGLNPQVTKKALDLLSLLGIIDTVLDPRPRIPDFIDNAEKVLGDRKEKVKALVINRLLDWEQKGRIRPCFNLLKILFQLGGKAQDPLILRCLKGDILSGSFSEIDKALADKQFENYTGGENIYLLKWIYETQKALCFRESDEIREAFLELPPQYSASAFSGYKARIQSNLSSYRLGTGEIDAASESVKVLMYLNQNLKDSSLPSYRFFSLLNVQKCRINDALEYSTFAVDMAEKSGDKDELIKASYFGAVVNYLQGNLFRAEELIIKAEDIALDLYRIPWAARSRFFHGRLRFESGRYREAMEIFESLKGIVSSGAAKETLAAWVFRTHVYLALLTSGESKKSIKAPDFYHATAGHHGVKYTDAGLFLVEAAFLLGKFDEAIKLCESYLSDPGIAEDNFFFTEQPDWKSGFSQCEAIFIPARTFRNRAISVYQALAQSRLSPSQEYTDKLSIKAENMIREYLLSDWDTNGVFYLYALYLIQKDAGSSRSSISTLNMAYRRFRSRANCIESKKLREDYISLNYWNNALYLAAREHKLI